MDERRVQGQQYREEINSDQQIPCTTQLSDTYILIPFFSRPREQIETSHGRQKEEAIGANAILLSQ